MRERKCDFIATDHMKEMLTFISEVMISLTELHVLFFRFLLIAMRLVPHACHLCCYTVHLYIKAEICLFMIDRVIVCSPVVPGKLKICSLGF